MFDAFLESTYQIYVVKDALCFPWWLCMLMSWWRHQMETFSALLVICAGNSAVHGEFPAQRPVTRSFDVPLICARIYGWVNNHEAGDLRRHHSHYDVIVMVLGWPHTGCQIWPCWRSPNVRTIHCDHLYICETHIRWYGIRIRFC